jgi:diguanylate cyclase (GGDEF)-like protein
MRGPTITTQLDSDPNAADRPAVTTISETLPAAPPAQASANPPISPFVPGPDAPGTIERDVAEILVVEDSPTTALLLEMGLKEAGFRVRVAHDGGKGLCMAREHCPDVVLADVMMPVLDGVQLTQRLREDPRTAGATIILVTAKGYPAAKLEGFQAGADDYIVKPFDIQEVLARINGALRRTKMLRAQSPLTGLPGSIQFQEEMELRLRRRADFALLYCDLDNFKSYNDKYGFLRGDRVIQMTARALQDTAIQVGGRDAFVGHIGGDDFVVVAELGHEKAVAESVIARFDAEILSAYDDVDRERGYIETLSRRGEPQRFPIVAISIGAVTTERRTFSHYAETVVVATEMKSLMKKTAGSSWAVDLRAG